MSPSEVDEAMTMIHDCLKRDHKMSAWECDFMESIQDHLTERGHLTEKQLDTLSTIWEKVT